MAQINYHADSLRRYLTGAVSQGGSQASPNASLGGYASSTQVAGLVSSVTSPITGITISYVSPHNGIGNGTLAASGTNALTWTAPNGSQGSHVNIINGGSVVLEDGSDPGKYIVVSSSTATVSGSSVVSLSRQTNNVIGMNDSDPSETSAGSVRYRAIMLKNVSGVSVNNVKAFIPVIGSQLVSGASNLGASGAGTIQIANGSFDASGWPASGFCRISSSAGTLKEIVYYSSRTSNTLTIPTAGRALLGTSATLGDVTDKIDSVPGMRIAIEAPVANAIQTIANDTTSPTGRTWSTAISAANGLNVGQLAAGAEYGLWIERTIVPGSSAIPVSDYSVGYSFDAA